MPVYVLFTVVEMMRVLYSNNLDIELKHVLKTFNLCFNTFSFTFSNHFTFSCENQNNALLYCQ